MVQDSTPTKLEDQLKVLGQKIRHDILKKLSSSETLLSYSQLKYKLKKVDPKVGNITFHINKLKDNGLIDLMDQGYKITDIGVEFLKSIINLENFINKQKNTIMIRTSRYTTEPFNLNKIKDYLINEGAMESYQADKIATIVKDRLSQTNIEYMTAPLMREYINAILLENDCEETRHRLTRLGTPPIEVNALLASPQFCPSSFLKSLGSDISEQFLLLNLLPQNLSDLYLSRKIHLTHLNYWALRPHSIFLPETLMNELLPSEKKLHGTSSPVASASRLIFFKDMLNQLTEFFSQDIILGNFHGFIKPSFSRHQPDTSYLDVLANIMTTSLDNSQGNVNKYTLSLNKLEDQSNFESILCFLSRLKKASDLNASGLPLILFNSSMNYSQLELVREEIEDLPRYLMVNNKDFEAMTSSIVWIKKVGRDDESFIHEHIILDKIMINMNTLALNASKDDDKFLDEMEDLVQGIFSLYQRKVSLLNKSLSNSKRWNALIERLSLKTNSFNWSEGIKPISFFNLNQGIKHHCGIEFDRLKTSEKFTLKILKLMKNLIKEKNEEDGENFVLCQPHDDLLEKKFNSNMIRQDSGLSLERKINLFKRIEEQVEGGTIFCLPGDTLQLITEADFNNLKKSGISAFKLN